MEHINGIMEVVGNRLGETTKSEIVVGAPIELGGVTLVVLSRVALGLGAGGGSGAGEAPKKGAAAGKGKGEGGGTGGGAKVRPVAVAVFTADGGVDILHIPERKGKLDELLDRLPPLVERLAAIKPKSA
ncbi:MAG: hypothetical protein HY908_08960 [Myxococcales bacterium]|nr:hypothetical protein [Myxococcales bacterium]